MFIQFLRENRYVSLLLTVLRVYLGWEWLNAGWGKISSDKFDASGFLYGAVKKVSGEHPEVQTWWGNFLQDFALPYVELFNVLVPWGEFLVGLALIIGVFTHFAMLMSLTMNFAYMFSGSTSTNPQMAIIGIFILIAGINAGKIGLDRWVIPYIKTVLSKKSESDKLTKSA